jgi:hypothetical protein
MGARIGLLLSLSFGLSVGGCYHPAHCQSGSKHGTECYTQLSPGDPPAQEKQRDEEDPPRNPVAPTTPR